MPRSTRSSAGGSPRGSAPATVARMRSYDRAAASRSRRFALEAMHPCRLNAEGCQEGRERHAVVRVGRLRRHAAFITPEELDLRPVQRGAERRLCQASVHGARRQSARQRDQETAALRERGPPDLDDLTGRSVGERARIRDNSKRHGVQLYTSPVSFMGRRPEPGRTTVALRIRALFRSPAAARARRAGPCSGRTRRPCRLFQ